jgi:hypothetical protein
VVPVTDLVESAEHCAVGAGTQAEFAPQMNPLAQWALSLQLARHAAASQA